MGSGSSAHTTAASSTTLEEAFLTEMRVRLSEATARRFLNAKLAEARGEVTADVTTAKALNDKQKTALAAALKQSAGREVKINQTVDESLIGGLIVKVGSKMIDSSIASRLNALQNSMKEVG